MSTYSAVIVMDPIQGLNLKKDTTLAMIREAQARGVTLYYCQPRDLWVRDGMVYAELTPFSIDLKATPFYTLGTPEARLLHTIDVVLMRKDPPFDMEYIYSTYLLEMAERKGTLVVNRPESVRAANEKLFATWFAEFCPPTLVTRDIARIKAFITEQQFIVVKPLDGMGGSQVFQVKADDSNQNVILETITHNGQRTVMAQRFLPEYRQGDKRILIINGKPYPHALARIPAIGEARANLAAGGKGVGVDLTPRDYEICAAIAPTLVEMGLLFVGLDVIGDYVTEINVTSPTGVRELETQYGDNITALMWDAIEQTLEQRQGAAA
ncbi:glutathione synthase [Thiofilum flexile]|uniref:glutathione synthase n=1 Tax=Thiofilum flexile TaxID=125627 RepID=UPI00036CAA09|nr:glutathione synthase [Thiofilum flexile]